MSLFSESRLAITEAVLQVFQDQLAREEGTNKLSLMKKEAIDKAFHDRKWHCVTELEASKVYIRKWRSEATDIVCSLLLEARNAGEENIELEEKDIINLIYEPILFESIMAKNFVQENCVELFEKSIKNTGVQLLASGIGCETIVNASARYSKVYTSCFRRASDTLLNASLKTDRQDLLIGFVQAMTHSSLWAEHVLMLGSESAIWSGKDIAMVFISRLLSEVKEQVVI